MAGQPEKRPAKHKPEPPKPAKFEPKPQNPQIGKQATITSFMKKVSAPAQKMETDDWSDDDDFCAALVENKTKQTNKQSKTEKSETKQIESRKPGSSDSAIILIDDDSWDNSDNFMSSQKVKKEVSHLPLKGILSNRK